MNRSASWRICGTCPPNGGSVVLFIAIPVRRMLDPVRQLAKLVIAQPTCMNYIFVDEIQKIAEFEKALRSLLLNSNGQQLLTLGS